LWTSLRIRCTFNGLLAQVCGFFLRLRFAIAVRQSVIVFWRCVMPKVAFDLGEIAQEFMAAYAGWFERAQAAKVEERLAAERELNKASYLASGRRFETLTDTALKQRWIKCLRRTFSAHRRQRVEMDDIADEISMRRLNIKLPKDVRELIGAGPRPRAAG
jgi:hypothetical protein